MPRWSAPLLAVAVCGLTAAGAGASVFGGTGAYWERAEAWLATQPTGTPISAFPLVDGTYKGVAETVVAQGASCPAADPGTITIGDRRLIFPFSPNVIFIAPVQPDGSLVARIVAIPPTAPRGRGGARAAVPPPAPIGSLDGRIGGGALEFTVRTPSCETRYRLRWVM